MDFSTATKIATSARLREQPAIILELVHAYRERAESAGTGAHEFAYGYVAALEWVLQVTSGESFKETDSVKEPT